jgi:hypothetical protein
LIEYFCLELLSHQTNLIIVAPGGNSTPEQDAASVHEPDTLACMGETLGGPPSGPGGFRACRSEGLERAPFQDRGMKGHGAGGSLADVMRRGRECRRECGLDLPVLVLAPGPPPTARAAEGLPFKA